MFKKIIWLQALALISACTAMEQQQATELDARANKRISSNQAILHSAVLLDNADIIDQLITDHLRPSDFAPDSLESIIEAQDEEGHTAFEVAIRNSKFEAAARLYDFGADTSRISTTMKSIIEAKDHEGYTPLERAVKNRKLLVVCCLLASGANSERVMKNAISDDDPETISFLAQFHRFNFLGGNWIHHAAYLNRTKAIARLVELGCDVNKPEGYSQRTPLHYAAWENHVDTIKCLHRLGADLEAMDGWNNTPMHNAASKDSTKAIECLLALGASIESTTVGCVATPLISAVFANNLNALITLYLHGANLEAETKDGRSLRTIAAEGGWHTPARVQACFDLIIELKKFYATNSDKSTKTHFELLRKAIAYGFLPLIKQLTSNTEINR